MAGPYTVAAIRAVPLSSTESILRDQRGRTLPEASRVQIFANRATADITFNITVGSDSVVEDQGAVIAAVTGTAPNTRDDKIADTFGNAGDEIVVRAQNADAATAREARVTIFVTPIDDVALQNAMGGFNQI